MVVGPYLISFDDERLDFFLLQQFHHKTHNRASETLFQKLYCIMFNFELS